MRIKQNSYNALSIRFISVYSFKPFSFARWHTANNTSQRLQYKKSLLALRFCKGPDNVCGILMIIQTTNQGILESQSNVENYSNQLEPETSLAPWNRHLAIIRKLFDWMFIYSSEQTYM